MGFTTVPPLHHPQPPQTTEEEQRRAPKQSKGVQSVHSYIKEQQYKYYILYIYHILCLNYSNLP